MTGRAIGYLITALCGVAIGGAVYGADQHGKRRREQDSFRVSLEALEEQLASKEAELEHLHARLGEKNAQVRVLAQEVSDLRAVVATVRVTA